MKKTILFAFFAMLLPILANAYDFEKDGIYYNINSDGISVTVTCEDSYRSDYTGSIVIPSTTQYNNKLYSVTSIGLCAFYECTGLTSITIPESVTSIDSQAFYGCSELTSVIIPNSVTTVGTSAFSGCSSLASITFGNNVESIGSEAFENTAWLDNQPNGLVYAGKVAYKYKGTMPENAHITIKEGTLGIAGHAFYGWGFLTSVTIPNGLTNIGEGAFFYTDLQSFNIPESVTSIGGQAFEGTTWLYNHPEGLVYAGKVLYTHKGYIEEGTHITIKDGTLGIAACAFFVDYCKNIASVTIPESVKSIGNRAFYECTGLTSITIPNSVTFIGEETFESSGLTSINIPESVKSIGNRAFANSNLKTIILPNSLTSIGDQAFNGCSGLTSITIPESVTGIGNLAFSGCGSLTSVTLPNSLTRIPEGSFSGCSSLSSITIPNSVTSIGNAAFNFCSNLASVTIGNGVTSIGDFVFEECTGLKSVTCLAKNVPNTGDRVFIYVPTSSATLYVPASALDDYKSAEQWEDFGTILPIDEPTYILGDANGSGGVEIGDITSVLTLMANPDAMGYNNKAADANQSGMIEIGDITTILTIMAGE